MWQIQMWRSTGSYTKWSYDLRMLWVNDETENNNYFCNTLKYYYVYYWEESILRIVCSFLHSIINVCWGSFSGNCKFAN